MCATAALSDGATLQPGVDDRRHLVKLPGRRFWTCAPEFSGRRRMHGSMRDQLGSPGRNAPAGILICGSLPGGLVCRGGRADRSTVTEHPSNQAHRSRRCRATVHNRLNPCFHDWNVRTISRVATESRSDPNVLCVCQADSRTSGGCEPQLANTISSTLPARLADQQLRLLLRHAHA